MIKKLFTFLCLCTLCIGSAWGASPLVIDANNFAKAEGGSGSGYAPYNGTRTIGGISIYTSQVMLQSGAIQFQTNKGIMYNKTAMPGKITKITLKTSTNLTIKVGTSENPTDGTSVASGSTVTGEYNYFLIIGGSSTPKPGSITIEYEESTNPKYEITTASNPTSAGDVTATPTTQETGKQVILTETHNDAYNFTSWSITKTEDGTETGIAVDGDGKFTMPAYAVTATANFTAKENYSITYYVNGTQETVSNVYAGTIISSKLPVPSSGVSGYVFKGWIASPIEGAVQTAPSYYDTTQGISGNITLYAVFAFETKENVAFSSYEKVTTAPSDWSGKYLLSTGEITFTGQSGSNTYGDYESFEPGTTEQTQYEVEVAKTTNGYSMYHNGKYLGLTSNSNALHFSTDFKATDYEWTFDTKTGAGHGIISVRNSDYALKYNSGSPRFACYTSAQTHVYMYKRIETGTITYSDYCTTINIEAGNVTFEVGEGATFKKNDTFTAQETTVKPGTYTNLPSASKPLYTFEGWYLSTDVNQEVVSSITVADGDDLTYVAKWQGLSLSNTADVTEAGDYKVQGTVVATTAEGFVVGDASGFAYVYTGSSDHGKAIGDNVIVIGSVSEYAGILEFKDNLEISEAASSTYDASVQPIVINASGLVNLISSKQPQFIEYIGVLSYSGTYYNIAVKGTTDAYGRIYSPSTDQTTALAELLGGESSAEVKVKGYYVGVGNNKYANTILGTIEAYEIPSYTLTVNVEGEGCDVDVKINNENQTGTDGVYSIKEGEKVSLVQKAATHFTFAGWSSDYITISDEEQTATLLTFYVAKNIEINASFKEDENVSITWSVNGVTDVIEASKVYVGEVIEFPATVDDVYGKKFVGWVSESNKDYSHATDAPTYANATTVIAKENATYYAVLADCEGTSTDYSYTITTATSDYSSDGYKSGTKTITAVCPTDNTKTTQVEYYIGNFGQVSKKLQMKSGSSMYNTTDLGSITSVTIEDGSNLTTYYGTSKNPTSNTSVGTDNGYFTIKASSTGTCSSITVKFTKGSYTYSNYTTSIQSKATMSITSAKWGTFCAPFNVTIPADVTAYTATETNGKVTFNEITTTIPAGTPVVVYSENTVSETFNGIATVEGDNCRVGVLIGYYVATSGIPASDTDVQNYVLQNNTTGVGFYKANKNISLNANRCYMSIKSQNAKESFLFDEITGINAILNNKDKSVEGIFDLNGRRLPAPRKGVNIINGVKVIVK